MGLNQSPKSKSLFQLVLPLGRWLKWGLLHTDFRRHSRKSAAATFQELCCQCSMILKEQAAMVCLLKYKQEKF